jgi:hypothetical protein
MGDRDHAGEPAAAGRKREAAERQNRLAAALRENLMKRKQQARARKTRDEAQAEAGSDLAE